MDVKSLIPWGRNRSVPAPSYVDEPNPFLALHREMDRLFDHFLRDFDVPFSSRSPWSAAWPHVEVSETEKEVKVVAELPGLEEKDVELTLEDGTLTLKGEKRHEEDGSVYSERWHGRFERSIALGAEVDPDKAKASFRNGVLTVTVAKRPEAQSRRKRIAING